MNRIFNEQDRQEVWGYIHNVTQECDRIVSLIQVGSGAIGYHDARSDLDYVIALDADDSMLEVMEYMHRKISEKYEIVYFSQEPSWHLQCYLLSNMLEIDIGYGGYEHAAARKPAFKVLFDRTGVVEEKMVQSREWMDDRIYGDKQKKDIAEACDSVWARMMHAAVAIHRNNFLRAIGELECIRRTYIDLLGDRYRLESGRNHDIDQLPAEEKEAVKSTLVHGEGPEELWTSLLNLTSLVYKELEGCSIPVSKEQLLEYYKDLR